MLNRIIRGDNRRRSRLHDEKGNFAGWKNVVLHAPPAVATAGLRLAFGYRPELPWISFSAIRKLSRFLRPASRVLEFGSGMSTKWYAKHAGQVFSVEHDVAWYNTMSASFERDGVRNVTYRLAEGGGPEYWSFMSDDPTGFDLIMIDGVHRSQCLDTAAKLLRPGGVLYLDNSDKDSVPAGGDMRSAEELALRFADSRHGTVTTFTDFAPTQLFVQQGLMVETAG